MNFPLEYEGGFLILAGGFLFGWFLEVSGLGSPRKLNAQFTLRDWTVFKVMFIAIVVAAAGIWLLTQPGWLRMDMLKVPTPFYYATALGGALLGAGLAIGGYCPGTSVVGFFSGRLDALFFMLGMLFGVLLFGLLFPLIKPLFLAAKGPKGQSLAQLTGLSGWGILLFLIILAIAGFWLGSRFEARGDGTITSRDLTTTEVI